MKYDPNKQSARAEVAKLAALYAPALTDEERREYDRLRAREMARWEARNRQGTQPELEIE